MLFHKRLIVSLLLLIHCACRPALEENSSSEIELMNSAKLAAFAISYHTDKANSINNALLRRLSKVYSEYGQTSEYAKTARSAYDIYFSQHLIAFESKKEEIKTSGLPCLEIVNKLEALLKELRQQKKIVINKLKSLRPHTEEITVDPSYDTTYEQWLHMPIYDAIQKLQKKYHIKGPQDCIASVGKHPINMRVRTNANYEILALLSGNKDIRMGGKSTLPHILYEFNDQRTWLTAFNAMKIGYLKAIRAGQLVFYRADCAMIEKRAHLLALALLQNNNIKHYDYLIGRLLGYPEEDLHFFQMVPFFGADINSNLQSGNYESWPCYIQASLDEWEHEAYNSPATEYQIKFREHYKTTVAEANDWIFQHEQKTIEELRNEIKQLSPSNPFVEKVVERRD